MIGENNYTYEDLLNKTVDNICSNFDYRAEINFINNFLYDSLNTTNPSVKCSFEIAYDDFYIASNLEFLLTSLGYYANVSSKDNGNYVLFVSLKNEARKEALFNRICSNELTGQNSDELDILARGILDHTSYQVNIQIKEIVKEILVQIRDGIKAMPINERFEKEVLTYSNPNMSYINFISDMLTSYGFLVVNDNSYDAKQYTIKIYLSEEAYLERYGFQKSNPSLELNR